MVAAEQTAASGWSLLQRVAFRFACSYLILYNLQAVGDLIPGLGFLSRGYNGLWHGIVPWVAIHVFHLSGPVTVYPAVNGSGDTTLDYIEVLCFVISAAVTTTIWSVLDHKRIEYRRLNSWLRVFIRYTLAFTLFSYGFAKVIPTQFVFPGFSRLIEPLGEFSPMGLLWYFMGYSTPYIIFSGGAEVTGGALLLFRRTTTLGAMVSFAVLLNVVMLNFCYDVPVKLYSTHLLLMSVFLMASDLGRLLNVLVLNRPVRPSNLGKPLDVRWMRMAKVALKIFIIGYFLFSTLKGSLEVYQKFIVGGPRPPLYGLYDVETFTRNGRDVPPLTTDRDRWKRVIVQLPTALSVRMMDDSPAAYNADYNAAKDTVTLTRASEKNQAGTLIYSRPDADRVLLEGKLSGDMLTIKLREVDTTKFLLVNRGFHWINERPFNR